MKHALILGATGVIGERLAIDLLDKNYWKVTGVGRTQCGLKSERMSWLCCDLKDKNQCSKVIGPVVDTVSHVFYVTWSPNPDENKLVDENFMMLKNVIDLFKGKNNLEYIYLQTGTKYYGFDKGPKSGYEIPACEDMPRLKSPNFYYPQEDYITQFCKESNDRVKYLIARPPCIIGITRNTAMNFGMSLAIYATVMKECQQPLIFPYGHQQYKAVREFVDNNVLSQFVLWALSDKSRLNDVYNIQNGDYVSMKQLWEFVGKYFDMPVQVADKPTSIKELMKNKEEVWDKVVKKYNLNTHKLNELVTVDFMDSVISRDWSDMTLMNKVVRRGWTHMVDTRQSFGHFFDGLKLNNIIPAYGVHPKHT